MYSAEKSIAVGIFVGLVALLAVVTLGEPRWRAAPAPSVADRPTAESAPGPGEDRAMRGYHHWFDMPRDPAPCDPNCR